MPHTHDRGTAVVQIAARVELAVPLTAAQIGAAGMAIRRLARSGRCDRQARPPGRRRAEPRVQRRAAPSRRPQRPTQPTPRGPGMTYAVLDGDPALARTAKELAKLEQVLTADAHRREAASTSYWAARSAHARVAEAALLDGKEPPPPPSTSGDPSVHLSHKQALTALRPQQVSLVKIEGVWSQTRPWASRRHGADRVTLVRA